MSEPNQRKHDLEIRLREVLEQEIEDFQEETGVNIKSIETRMIYMQGGGIAGKPGFNLQRVIVEVEP